MYIYEMKNQLIFELAEVRIIDDTLWYVSTGSVKHPRYYGSNNHTAMEEQMSKILSALERGEKVCVIG